jgi:hydrogenase expression/formation protein HypC
MCLSLPAQVVSLHSHTAVVTAGSTQLEVGRLLLPEARPGDWVLIQTGQMIGLITAEEVAGIRELWQEISAFSQGE